MGQEKTSSQTSVTISYGGNGILVNNEFVVRSSPDGNTNKIFVIARRGANVLYGRRAETHDVHPDRTTGYDVGVMGVHLDEARLVKIGERYTVRLDEATETDLTFTIESETDTVCIAELDPTIDQRDHLRRILRQNLLG